MNEVVVFGPGVDTRLGIALLLPVRPVVGSVIVLDLAKLALLAIGVLEPVKLALVAIVALELAKLEVVEIASSRGQAGARAATVSLFS